MQLIFVAGPFRAPTPWQVEQNVRRAEEASLDLWKIGGVAVICPHTNTRFFQDECPDEVWLTGIMEILRRCDAVFAVPGWSKSTGTMAEIAEAKRLDKPVFFSLQEVLDWLDS